MSFIIGDIYETSQWRRTGTVCTNLNFVQTTFTRKYNVIVITNTDGDRTKSTNVDRFYELMIDKNAV